MKVCCVVRTQQVCQACCGSEPALATPPAQVTAPGLGAGRTDGVWTAGSSPRQMGLRASWEEGT